MYSVLRLNGNRAGRDGERMKNKNGGRMKIVVPTDRYPFAIMKSAIHGVGVHTLASLPARKKIGELTSRLPIIAALRSSSRSTIAGRWIVPAGARWDT